MKTIGSIIACTFAAILLTPAQLASAASSGCVNVHEFRAIQYISASYAKVRHVFGTNGKRIHYYPGTDVDGSRMDDSVRTYRKCRSFDHGKGVVAINFDNYDNGPRMRVFEVQRNDPNRLFIVRCEETL